MYMLQSNSYLLTTTEVNKEVILRRIQHYDDFKKPKNGRPLVRYVRFTQYHVKFVFKSDNIKLLIFIYSILMGDDVYKNESLALVATGKTSLSYHYNISSFVNENFQQMPFGK